MSNHRQATAPGPSLVSIMVMALATLSTIGIGLWIIWGATDERDLTGAGLATVLAVVLMAQTVGRASDRATAYERQEARSRRFFAETVRRTEERAQEMLVPRAGRGPRTQIIGDAGRVVSLGTSPMSAIENWPQPIEQVGPWEDQHPTKRLTRPSVAMPLTRREEADEGQYPS